MNKTLPASLAALAAAFIALPAGAAGNADIATFENVKIEEGKTAWIGDTSVTEYTESYFKSGIFSFANQYTPEYGSWGAFAVTNSKSDVFNTYFSDQYNSAAG